MSLSFWTLKITCIKMKMKVKKSEEKKVVTSLITCSLPFISKALLHVILINDSMLSYLNKHGEIT